MSDPCTDWVAGWEVTGTLSVEASLAVAGPHCAATATAAATVDVGLDEEACHVLQEELTLVLNPRSAGCP